MPGQSVQIAIVADAGRAVAGLKETGDAATSMGKDFDKASKDVKELGDKMGDNASKSSQFAGGIGDIGGALAQVPGPLGAIGTGMEALGPSLMGAVGAFDLLELATNSNIVTSLRQKAATVASTAATVAQNIATKAAAAGQWLLNAAMTANPIGLIIIAVVALVAAFVLLWKKSETFRDIVLGTWSAIKTGAMAVFNFLKAYFIGVFNVYKTIFLKGIAAVRAVWEGLKWLFTRAVEIGTSIVDWFKALPGRLIAAVGNLLTTLKTKGAELIAGMLSGIKNAWTSLKEWVAGIGKRILDAIGNITNDFLSVGSNIVAGIKSGITNGWDKFMAWLKDKILGIVKNSMKWLGIGSPSKVMAEQVGVPMAEGIQEGFATLSADDLMKPLVRDIKAFTPPPVNVSGTGGGTADTRGAVAPIVVNFNGLVTDPIATAREIQKVFNAYIGATGRPILVSP